MTSTSKFAAPSPEQTIHMLWIGGSLSIMEQLSMASFLANGHDVILHTYGEVSGVPEGIKVSDGNDILPEETVFANTREGIGKGGFAGFSDWFRYELLQKRQGFWCDTDMVCLKPFDFEQPNIVATSHEGEWGTPALGCVLRLECDDPLLKFCLDFCRENDVAALVSEEYIAVGPGLLQRGIRELGLQHYQVNADVFCPISWRHTKYMVLPAPHRWVYNLKRLLRGGQMVGRVHTETRGLHLWQSTWKLGDIDPAGAHNPFSLYAQLRARYLPEVS